MSDDIFNEEESRYLIFSLGGELYGTPLLGVREVVEPQEAKPIPGTVDYFKGVINIRGQIVGVIDLRVRLQHPASKTVGNAFMVFDTSFGPIAAIVDRVESVIKIPEGNIERSPNVRTTVPIDFLLGIAREHERLITLIDLNQILASTDVKKISNILAGGNENASLS